MIPRQGKVFWESFSLHSLGWSPRSLGWSAITSLLSHPPSAGVNHAWLSLRKGYMHRHGRSEGTQILWLAEEKLNPAPKFTGTNKETLYIKVTQINYKSAIWVSQCELVPMFGDTDVLSVTDWVWAARQGTRAEDSKIKTLAGPGLCAIEIQACGVLKADHKGF